MKRFSLQEGLLTLPSLLWLILLFLTPTAIIFLYSFKPADLYGGVGEGWTLETILNLYNPYFFAVIWRTFWISFATAAICLLLALPMGYQMAMVAPRWRYLLFLMVVIPFWSSFLIRIFAWKRLLHPEGTLHELLVFLGIIAPETPLLYNSFALLLVMVYTFLPFAVLPIYSAASKFNIQLMEAAMDLGASRFQSFFRVFIPAIKRAIFTALLMVLIPAFGTYVIPDLVGGARSEMIGNKIAQKTFVERNLPEASAISLLLTLAIFLPTLFIALYAKRAATSLGSRE